MVTSDLTGKATTTDPVEVTTDPLMLIYLIKTAILLVRVRQMIQVMSRLHRQNLFLKVMSLLRRTMQNIRIVLHLNRKATDTTPPTAPVVTSDLTGKATTTDPVEVTTDPNTKVELLDKDGNVIGSGTTDDTGHVTITPTRPIPVGNVSRKLMTMRKFLMLRLLNRRKQLIRHLRQHRH